MTAEEARTSAKCVAVMLERAAARAAQTHRVAVAEQRRTMSDTMEADTQAAAAVGAAAAVRKFAE